LADIADFASKCLPNDKNIVVFDSEAETDTVNINFTPQHNLAVGVCEVEIWVPANTGDFYYAADALAQGDMNVVFDSSSTVTSNGAVLAQYSSSSEIDFSGIYSANGGSVDMRISFKYNGTSKLNLGASVNQFPAGNVTLQSTNGSGYEHATLNDIKLWKGTNFVTIYGREGLFIEGLGVS
jgi:hypothetical protein